VGRFRILLLPFRLRWIVHDGARLLRLSSLWSGRLGLVHRRFLLRFFRGAFLGNRDFFGRLIRPRRFLRGEFHHGSFRRTAALAAPTLSGDFRRRLGSGFSPSAGKGLPGRVFYGRGKVILSPIIPFYYGLAAIGTDLLALLQGGAAVGTYHMI